MALERSIRLINEVCATVRIVIDGVTYLQLISRLLLIISNFERGFHTNNSNRWSDGVNNFNNNIIYNLCRVWLPVSVVQLLRHGMQFAPLKHLSPTALRNNMRASVSCFTDSVARKLAMFESRKVGQPIRIRTAKSDWSYRLWNFHNKFKLKCSWNNPCNVQCSLNIEHVSSLEFLNTELNCAIDKTFFVQHSNLTPARAQCF
jgi:hypothetical protein